MNKHTFKVEYEEYDSADLLSDEEQRLIKSAWNARKYAYAPYSDFLVGAAVLTKNGKVFRGSNQENAVFKVSCAERVVLNLAAAKGYKKQISKIAVVGGDKLLAIKETPEKPEEPAAPCGQCRQDIKEHEDLSGEPITIILASRNMVRKFVGIESLLPFPFGAANFVDQVTLEEARKNGERELRSTKKTGKTKARSKGKKKSLGS